MHRISVCTLLLVIEGCGNHGNDLNAGESKEKPTVYLCVPARDEDIEMRTTHWIGRFSARGKPWEKIADRWCQEVALTDPYKVVWIRVDASDSPADFSMLYMLDKKGARFDLSFDSAMEEPKHQPVKVDSY